MSKKVWSKIIDNEIAHMRLKKMEREKHLEYIKNMGRKPPDGCA